MATDSVSNCLETIEEELKAINQGMHYFYSNYITLTSGATQNYTLKIGSKEIHYLFTLNSDTAGFSYQTYEGITADDDGTKITLFNNNRTSTAETTAVLRLNPANIVTTGSTMLRNGVLGNASAVPARSGGSLTAGNKVILKPNTKYLLKITNLVSADNPVSVGMAFVEYRK